MTHRFTVKAQIHNVSIDEFSKLAADPAMHEKVAKRIPGEDIQIHESKIENSIYTLKRSYNLEVNIPDIAKKLLKDAFRLKRTDITDLNSLSSTVDLGANIPLEAHCERLVTGDQQHLNIQLIWVVKVKLPLIGGMLEKHAENEIRRFSEIEIAIVEDELKTQLNRH